MDSPALEQRLAAEFDGNFETDLAENEYRKNLARRDAVRAEQSRLFGGELE